MTTVVSVAQGGTGSNSAALARTALGVPPSAAYDQANTARDQANTARTQANSAYSDANTRLSASGGTLAGDLIITGNLTVSGNSTTLNAEILTIEDADIVLLSNVASTPALNAGIIVNRGTSTNTFLRWDEVTDKWGWSDDGSTTYKFTSALDAYAQANSAYSAANNRVLKAGDTMTGQLNISAGGLLVTGNVGIGTSSPGFKFTTSGSAQLYTSAAAIAFYDTAAQTNSRNWIIGNIAAGDYGDLTFASSTSAGGAPTTQRMTLNYIGNLGIGTASPGTKLHILDSTGPVFRMVRTSNRFDVEVDNNAMGFVSRDSATANAYFSGFAGVGIGTINPQGKLHVASQSLANVNYNNQGAVFFEASESQVQIISDDGGSHASKLTLSTVEQSSGNNKHWMLDHKGPSLNNRFDISYFTSNTSGNILAPSGVEKLSITTNGNVGIGTTNPSEKFAVRGTTDLGNSDASSLLSLHTTRLSGYALRYDVSNRYGNYGVLIFNADSGWTNSARRFMITNGIDATKFAIIRSADATTDPTLGDAGSITSGTADFVINNSGNIGIGTTSPISKTTITRAVTNTVTLADSNNASHLTLAGSDALVRLQLGCGGTSLGFAGWIQASYDNTGGAFGVEPLLLNPSGGNVGIGTTSPAAKFVVSNGGALGLEVAPADGLLQFYNRSTSAYGNFICDGATFIWRPSGTERMRLAADGSFAVKGAAGTYSLDTHTTVASYANGATVDFPAFSGMILANDTNSTGHVTIWLVGFGNATAAASHGSTVGSMAYNAAVAGYRWTNNSGATRSVAFMAFRTRDAA